MYQTIKKLDRKVKNIKIFSTSTIDMLLGDIVSIINIFGLLYIRFCEKITIKHKK